MAEIVIGVVLIGLLVCQGVLLLRQTTLIVTTIQAVKPTANTRTPETIHAAVQVGLVKAGVSLDHFGASDADLISTGKLDQVLFHAAAELGRSVRTTGEVESMLAAALLGSA